VAGPEAAAEPGAEAAAVAGLDRGGREGPVAVGRARGGECHAHGHVVELRARAVDGVRRAAADLDRQGRAAATLDGDGAGRLGRDLPDGVRLAHVDGGRGDRVVRLGALDDDVEAGLHVGLRAGGAVDLVHGRARRADGPLDAVGVGQ
jgi:hypothetical protein